MKEYEIEDRVVLAWGLLPHGEIVEKLPKITLNGLMIVEPKYKVKYDDYGGESGWVTELALIEEKKCR